MFNPVFLMINRLHRLKWSPFLNPKIVMVFSVYPPASREITNSYHDFPMKKSIEVGDF